MQGKLKKRLLVGAIAVGVLAGTGAAVAAGELGSGAAEQAILDDAAERLGVEPQELRDALREAIEARIDAAVADGRLTEEQAALLKQRLEEGSLPILRGPWHVHGFHPGPGLDAAATYLGLSRDELHEALASGKSLADIAAEQGKSVDGLKSAMLEDAKAHLDRAVADGRLTEAQAESILAGLSDRLDAIINRTLPPPRRHHHPHPNGMSPAPGEVPPPQMTLDPMPF